MFLSHPEYFHDFIAKMIDDFYGDAAAGWAREGAGGVGVEGCPGILVDLGLQGGFQALVGVVCTKEVGFINSGCKVYH
jgi:hypothetical protein